MFTQPLARLRTSPAIKTRGLLGVGVNQNCHGTCGAKFFQHRIECGLGIGQARKDDALNTCGATWLGNRELAHE